MIQANGSTLFGLATNSAVDSMLNSTFGPDESIADNLPVPMREPSSNKELQTVRMMKGRDIILCPLLDVSYFEAHGKYTRVVLRDTDGLLQMSMQAVEAKLPADRFIRIHRSHIVNVVQIHLIKRDEFGRMMLTIHGRNEQLNISRPHEHLFRAGIF